MTKLILADNQAIFRAGTARVLAMEEEFRIIAQCSDAERLYSAMDTFRGSLVLFATTLKPDMRLLLHQLRTTESRSLAILENNESASTVLGTGLNGLVHRSVSGPNLIDCVRRVASGEMNVQPSVMPARDLEEDMVGARVKERLTPKEMKIVALIVMGCKNKEIAMRLGTTEQVVKNYLRSIYDKTGVSDRLELALFTIHHRILAEAAEAAGNLMMQN